MFFIEFLCTLSIIHLFQLFGFFLFALLRFFISLRLLCDLFLWFTAHWSLWLVIFEEVLEIEVINIAVSFVSAFIILSISIIIFLSLFLTWELRSWFFHDRWVNPSLRTVFQIKYTDGTLSSFSFKGWAPWCFTRAWTAVVVRRFYSSMRWKSALSSGDSRLWVNIDEVHHLKWVNAIFSRIKRWLSSQFYNLVCLHLELALELLIRHSWFWTLHWAWVIGLDSIF